MVSTIGETHVIKSFASVFRIAVFLTCMIQHYLNQCGFEA